MGGSLKDQLLALGLRPAQERQKRPQNKGSHASVGTRPKPPKAEPGSHEIPLEQAFRLREREDRRVQAKALQDQREQERQRRETNSRIRTLIKAHAVHDDGADCKRNFLYKGRIRSVLATAEQVHAINEGSLGVVYLRGNYYLLPADKVTQVLSFAADHVPDLRGENGGDEQEHPVPDDLIW